MGRLPNDNQRQRALGVDMPQGSWLFRGPSPPRQAEPVEVDGAGTDCTQQIHQAQLAPLEKYAHHRSGKVALKSRPTDKKAAATDVGRRRRQHAPHRRIRRSVANANAQLAAAECRAATLPRPCRRGQQYRADAPNNPADAQPAADNAQVVAADQLNDVDRALHEASPPRRHRMPAGRLGRRPAARDGRQRGQPSTRTWDETSLIGKIFIGFGALLTMASAARMFMA